MQLELTFLGTSSMFPTKKRNHAAMLLRYEGNYLLFDCGEGTQRQMRIAGLSPYKVGSIFLSHWHGDHSLGVGGMIQSMSASGRTENLDVFGPAETRERIRRVMDTYIFRKNFRVMPHDIDSRAGEKILESSQFSVSAINVKHNVPCVAYRFDEAPKRKINMEYVARFGLKQHPILGKLQKGEDIEWNGKKITAEKGTTVIPGRSVAYVTDLTIDRRVEKFCRNVDVLVCESTYSKEDKKLLGDRQHVSTVEAAELAKKAGAKKLILTHFSQRYAGAKRLAEEAKEVFPNAAAAKDFMTVKV